jgi:AcrR family transcriptional regulator
VDIGREKRRRTRAALIEAAMKVFARLGPDAPIIDDFIAEAGVARGTFYNYFETREELLIAVATELSDRLLARMLALRALPDPADRVSCSVRAFVRLAAADHTSGWVIVRIALVAAPLGASMQDYLAEDVRAGLASGRFRVSSPQAAADLILGAGLMGMRSVLRGDADETHAEHVAQAVLSALGVKGAATLANRSMDAEAISSRSKNTRSARNTRPVYPTIAKPRARRCHGGRPHH